MNLNIRANKFILIIRILCIIFFCSSPVCVHRLCVLCVYMCTYVVVFALRKSSSLTWCLLYHCCAFIALMLMLAADLFTRTLEKCYKNRIASNDWHTHTQLNIYQTNAIHHPEILLGIYTSSFVCIEKKIILIIYFHLPVRPIRLLSWFDFLSSETREKDLQFNEEENIQIFCLNKFVRMGCGGGEVWLLLMNILYVNIVYFIVVVPDNAYFIRIYYIKK